MFDLINLSAICAATIAAFLFGSAWYGVLGRRWMRAAGLTPERTAPSVQVFGIALVSQFVMAFVLAGVIYHTGETTISTGLISGALAWLGFVMSAMMVNHRFQGASWELTLIDGGHWLGVLLIQGAIIGWFGT